MNTVVPIKLRFHIHGVQHVFLHLICDLYCIRVHIDRCMERPTCRIRIHIWTYGNTTMCLRAFFSSFLCVAFAYYVWCIWNLSFIIHNLTAFIIQNNLFCLFSFSLITWLDYTGEISIADKWPYSIAACAILIMQCASLGSNDKNIFKSLVSMPDSNPMTSHLGNECPTLSARLVKQFGGRVLLTFF